MKHLRRDESCRPENVRRDFEVLEFLIQALVDLDLRFPWHILAFIVFNSRSEDVLMIKG